MGRIGSNCVDGRAHDYDGLRYGMFDWIVGWASHTWPSVPQCQICLHEFGSWWTPCSVAASSCTGLLGNRAWRRSFSGMWLRGLVWWLPPSVAMCAAGHGHALALASVSFPLVYELGGRLQPAKDAPEHWGWVTGGFISYSEFFFGVYIWLVITSTLLGTSYGCKHKTDRDQPFADVDAEATQVRQTVGNLQASQNHIGTYDDATTRRDNNSLGAQLLDRGSRPELHSDSLVGSGQWGGSSVRVWVCDVLSLGSLPAESETCVAQRGCRWALRVLNVLHLVLSLATAILLAITVVQNRLGMCESC